jgi:hypothetical protein
MAMPRKWLRPIAGVTLALFVVANGPLGAGARAAGCCRHTANEPATAEPTASCCEHCRSEQKRAAPAERAPVTLDRSDNATDGSRPCPQHGSCPCPGGCMFCSVAKVPCCVPVASLMVLMPCLEQSLAEDSLHFPPLLWGKLIRPPRA